MKELEHCVTISEDSYYEQLASQYQKGHEDALKSLPKWKKSTEQKDFNCLVARLEDDRRVVIISEVLKGDYYIELNDLKTLQKEE